MTMDNEPTKQPQAADRAKCGSCHNFLKMGEDGSRGECRLNPPTAFPTGFSAYPQVNSKHGYCRSHEPTAATAIREKVRPETPAQAAKARAPRRD